MPKKLKIKKLGARGGIKIRASISKIEEVERKKYLCKVCDKKKVKRIGTGIWKCKGCNTVYAGGAYSFETAIAKELYRGFER